MANPTIVSELWLAGPPGPSETPGLPVSDLCHCRSEVKLDYPWRAVTTQACNAGARSGCHTLRLAQSLTVNLKAGRGPGVCLSFNTFDCLSQNTSQGRRRRASTVRLGPNWRPTESNSLSESEFHHESRWAQSHDWKPASGLGLGLENCKVVSVM